jgi:hypothetical protein
VSDRRRAYLLLIHPSGPDDRLVVYPFEGARMTAGRSPECSISIDVPGMSGEHARLERTRAGELLRVTDLASRNGTQVNGWKVPSNGADCEVGSLIRMGEALFVYRMLTEEEADDAARPPLPGPVNTRHAPLVTAIKRIQRKVSAGGPIWLCGPPGTGRSVLQQHLRGLAGDFRSSWITSGELDFRISDTPPRKADPNRTVVFPPLRDRIEDVLVLTRALCAPKEPTIGPRLMEALHLYDWPGNTRELRVMLERAFHPNYAAMPGTAWDIDAFPDVHRYLMLRPKPTGRAIGRSGPLPEEGRSSFRKSPDATELRQCLERHQWKLLDACGELGVSRAALLGAMAKVGLRGPAHGPQGASGPHSFPAGLNPRSR